MYAKQHINDKTNGAYFPIMLTAALKKKICWNETGLLHRQRYWNTVFYHRCVFTRSTGELWQYFRRDQIQRRGPERLVQCVKQVSYPSLRPEYCRATREQVWPFTIVHSPSPPTRKKTEENNLLLSHELYYSEGSFCMSLSFSLFFCGSEQTQRYSLIIIKK